MSEIKTGARSVPQARAGDTYTIKGGGDVMWGVDGVSDLGTITNVSVDESAEHELLLNQQGAVTGVVVYDVKSEVKLTVIAKAAATKPVIGTALTAGGVSGIVMATSDSKEYKGLRKFEVTVNDWTNFTVGTT